MKAGYLGDWRTVVRDMLTQKSSWLPSATYNAGAAVGLRWNGKRWERIGKKRKKEEDESDSQPTDDALAAGAEAGMRWNGKQWERIVEKAEKKETKHKRPPEEEKHQEQEKEEDNPEDEVEGDVDLTEEVEK